MNDDYRARSPARAETAQDLAQRADRAVRRRELICAHHPGGAQDLDDDSASLAQKWAARDYEMQWPFVKGSGIRSALSIQGMASRPMGTCDCVLLLAGSYVAYGVENDDDHAEASEGSILGYVGVRVRPFQYTEGSSTAVPVDVEPPDFEYFAIRFPPAKRGQGSHFLHTQHFLTYGTAWQHRQNYCYREGQLHIPGTDTGIWDRAVFTVDLDDDFDHRRPVGFLVSLDIDDSDEFGEFPKFLSDEFASKVEADPDDPDKPWTDLMVTTVLGASVWSN